MENSGVQRSSQGTNSTRPLRVRRHRTIFFVKNFRLLNRVLLWSLLPHLVNLAIGEISQDTSSTSNSIVGPGQKIIFSKNGIFYANANTTSDNVNNYNHISNSNICLKKHEVKKREVRDEESVGSKVEKIKTNEKDRSMGSMGDEEDEDFGLDLSGETYETMGECNSCERDKVRIKFLETIKDSILSKLGMSRPPNVTDRPKPKIADHLLMMLMKKRHHSSNGLHWIQDNDSEEMLGDEPFDSRPSDKVRGKNSNFSSKNSFMRSQSSTSDNKYFDLNEFQEGEVLIDEEDDYHVRTERIVAFSQPHPKIRHLPHVQYFEFSDRVRASKVKRALLWINIKGRETTSVVGNKITISIYKVIDPGKPGISSSRESPVITSVRADSTQFIPSGSGAWITMEYIQIKNLVTEWFRYPQHNLGIVITAEDINRTNLAVTTNNGNDTANAPFLEVYVTDNRKHRTKRTIGLNCKDSSKETRCCRYPLTVDFVEFGWDWIIAPKKYEAFYCAGECPLAFLPQHSHTHIAQLSNIPGNGACCAPKKLSELDMLYFDQDMNIIFGKVPAMRVDRCGCT